MNEVCMQSHAFHMAFTAVIALAFYQTVIAIARNESQSLGFWTGVLMTAAVAVLIMPILAIPFIFGGLTAKPLALESVTARKVRKINTVCPTPYTTHDALDSGRYISFHNCERVLLVRPK